MSNLHPLTRVRVLLIYFFFSEGTKPQFELPDIEMKRSTYNEFRAIPLLIRGPGARVREVSIAWIPIATDEITD